MDLAITIIMTIGAAFIAIFSLPNLIYVIKTKNTNGVNLWMYIIFTIACICFSIYGFGIVLANNLKGGLPVLLANALCVIIACVTLTYKIINLKKAKSNNMTEMEYWKEHYEKR